MRNLDGRVAVVTGGGSGIGRGMALAFARRGMSVVVADIEEEAAADTVRQIRALARNAIAVRADVSIREDMTRVADEAYGEFNKVDVLCNNAGVSLRGRSGIYATHNDWKWLIGVNLWGVVNGVAEFLPRMLRQADGYILNTGSMYSHIPSPNSAVYSTTKYAVLGMSESLRNELRETNIRVSVLCASAVRTRSAEAGRNRPARLASQIATPPHVASASYEIAPPITPERVGELVIRAIEEERFYIFTDLLLKPLLEARHQLLMRDFEVLEQGLASSRDVPT